MASKQSNRKFILPANRPQDKDFSLALENALKKYAQKPTELKHGFDKALLELSKR